MELREDEPALHVACEGDFFIWDGCERHHVPRIGLCADDRATACLDDALDGAWRGHRNCDTGTCLGLGDQAGDGCEEATAVKLVTNRIHDFNSLAIRVEQYAKVCAKGTYNFREAVCMRHPLITGAWRPSPVWVGI